MVRSTLTLLALAATPLAAQARAAATPKAKAKATPAAAAAATPAAAPAAATTLAATSPPQATATTVGWDPATKTVKYQLIGGAPAAKSPFNFNGYTDGELTLTVPLGSTVVMTFINEDGVPHSAEVIADKDPMPNMAGNPALQRAYTIKAMEGMNQGEKDVMRFKADPVGTYRIFCGVPGHGLSGMWVRLAVSATATEPSVQTGGKKAG
ncbi:MAG: sulfocyanin-like copper-binding protein [Gemmatimonadales bacterium]|nr:sulfocyanin-like copper-binding protein [Gemmatimonadales bacterium]